MNLENKETKRVGLGPSAAVFVFTFLAILVGIKKLGTSAHVPLLLAAVAAAAVGRAHGFKWKEMEQNICDAIKAAVPAILIMMIIGMVVGTWIAGGIVPTMIYYGLTWLSPKIFLAAACLICAMVSMFTGSSWTTVGTMGVALMGIGAGMGIPAGMTAGAVISGAYFGDKLSPLSDTTNLAPAMAGTELFSHIKHMLYSTLPTFAIAIVLYLILGMRFFEAALNAGDIDLYLNTLSMNFNISPVMLIPPLCVLAMVLLKVPAIPGLLGVCGLGGLFAIIFQGRGLSEIFGAMYSGFSIDTGVEAVNKLVNRGGMSGMMDTVALILIAMCFAGIVEHTGMVHSIILGILGKNSSEKVMMTSAVFATLFTNFATGVQYTALVLPGRMYRQTFRDYNLHPKNLSRILEDVGTLCAPFCPYGTDAAFLAGTLGVTTGVYAPFMFFAALNPLMSLFCIWTGWTIEHIDPAVKDQDIIP